MSLCIGADAREWVQDRQTGIGRYLEVIVRRGLELHPDWKWILYQHKGDAQRVTSESVSYRILGRGNSVFVDQVLLPFHLRQDQPDLFFSPYPKSPWGVPCPVVVVVHDLHPLRLDPAYGGLAGFHRRWFMWSIGKSVRRAEKVVTVSEASARDIHQFLLFPEERIEVIYQAVSTSFSRELPKNHKIICEKQKLSCTFFIAVGNLSPHKNLATLIRAWSHIDSEHFPALLVLAGTGPYQPELTMLAKSVGVDDRVRFLGHVPDSDLPALYHKAVALLQPSLIEGFGLPVVEAMTCGTPAIVSEGGSLPEIVGDSMPVVTAEDDMAWAEVITRLLSEPHYRDQLSTAALDQAALFRQENTTDRMLTLLERAARSR